MHRHTPTWLATALLACAFGAAGGTAAATPDEDKLRLLSCDTAGTTPAARKQALDWFNRSAQALPSDGGMHLAGPVELGKACLRNVTVAGGFGAMIIQGEICNARLEDFTAALSAAGISLGKDVGGKTPGAVLGKVTDGGKYLVTRGMLDLRTGRAVPNSAPYAFMCSASGGGAQ